MSQKSDTSTNLSPAQSQQSPTIGRIVMYQNAAHAVTPAIIVAIRPESIGLFVFHDGGCTEWIQDAMQAPDETQAGWRWPTIIKNVPAPAPAAPAPAPDPAPAEPVVSAPVVTEAVKTEASDDKNVREHKEALDAAPVSTSEVSTVTGRVPNHPHKRK